jgi:hypothetical protein
MKTQGRAKVKSLPVSPVSGLGIESAVGEVLWSVDVPEHDEEWAHVRRDGDTWLVRMDDGRRLTVPVAGTLIEWRGVAAKVVGVSERVRAVLAGKPPPAEAAAISETYECPRCHSPFTRAADAVVCAWRDDPDAKDGATGTDCQLCGYGLQFHAEGLSGSKEAGCKIIVGDLLPDGVEVAPFDPRAERRQKLSFRLPIQESV